MTTTATVAITVVVFCLLFVGSTAHASSRAGTPPNIVFILSDDLGYGDLQPFSVLPPAKQLQTPNIIKFAKESMLFTEAYAGAPVCAPSRCTLMTGRHSGHCTIRENGPFLNPNDTTLAEVLKKNGYDTAIFGKWGLSEDDSKNPRFPINAGFDVYNGQVDQNICHNYYPSWMWLNGDRVNISANAKASVANCGPYHNNCTWTSDAWTNDSISYLQSRKSNPKPFFLYLSFTSPHAGSVGDNDENDVPAPRVNTLPYQNESWPKVEIDFATAVTLQDQQVGQVLAAIDSAGLTESTLVIFSSDNGAHNEGGHKYDFFTSSGPLNGFKRSLHEGGHRTPFIVRYPGKIAPGQVSQQQLAFYDIMATFADIAGIPASSLPVNDGYSFAPTLFGQKQAQPSFIYHEYCEPNENPTGWGQAVRMGNWSAVCIGPKPKSPTAIPACTTPQLYDLGTDVGQTKNVAADHPTVVQQLVSIMKQQHVPGGYCGSA